MGMSEMLNPVLDIYPVPKFNAFLMMRFTKSKTHRQIWDSIKREAERYAINVLRADDRNYHDYLWENVKCYMRACDYGIAVFDKHQDPLFNPNVCMEVGFMLSILGAKNGENRANKILLLKDKGLSDLHTDVKGLFYRTFDAATPAESLESPMREWLRDIGIAKRPNEKLVIFVSEGGQDRCAMAKIIANKLFEQRKPGFSLRFESMAAFFRGAVASSPLAREVVRDYYNEDLLASHRVMKKCDGMIEDADLILVMEKKFTRLFPAEKTRVITKFFGGSGDVRDPWKPKDERRADYQECFYQLLSLMEGRQSKLLDALNDADGKRARLMSVRPESRGTTSSLLLSASTFVLGWLLGQTLSSRPNVQPESHQGDC
jgi:protein-tyrosine-phosphatase